MMVNCPKCGFSQPEDQYCANCGIDMLAYRPTRAPLYTRILKSVPFQLTVLALVIGGGFAFIREKNRESIQERIAQIENASDTVLIHKRQEAASTAPLENKGTSRTTEVASAPVEAHAAPPPPPPQPAAAPPSTTIASTEPAGAAAADEAPPAASPPPAPASPAPSPAQAAERATAPQNLQISFVEISRTALVDLSGEAHAAGGYGSFITGVIPNSETRLKQLSGVKSLETPAVKQALRANQPVLVFRGMRDEASGQDLGLTVQVTPVSVDENGTQVQIEILRVLRDPGANPPIAEQTFQEQLAIPRGGTVFLAGALPHKASLPEEDARLYGTNPVLRILTSPAFQAGTSEFAIMIEAR